MAIPFLFTQELEQARRAGVTHPDNLPFLLQPETPNGRGVLLVHGFSATPHEMLELGKYLCARGFTALGVRLPGHGTSPEDLSQRRAEEWLAAVDRGYQALDSLELHICAAGLSTGALLLLKLSQLRKLEGMVLLSPFLKLKHALAPLAGLLSPLVPFQEREIAKEEQDYYYSRRPLKGIAQINRLRHQIKDELQMIGHPVLVLAAQGDETISPGTSERLFQQLGSQFKQFYCYGPEVPHVLTSKTNPQQQDVFVRTAEFLLKLPSTN